MLHRYSLLLLILLSLIDQFNARPVPKQRLNFRAGLIWPTKRMADSSATKSRELVAKQLLFSAGESQELSLHGENIDKEQRRHQLRKSSSLPSTLSMSFMTSTTMPSVSWATTSKRTITTKSSMEEDWKRSAGEKKMAKKRKKHANHSTSSPSPNTVVVGQPRAISNVTTLSSHKNKATMHAKKPQATRRNRGPNWHELSSTEQSIATMLRCQNLDTRDLLPAATTCRNLRSDKVCNYLFHEIDLRSGRRDVKCNLQGLEDIAESCRKSCGICCEDINFACEDDANGIVECARQLDKCHQKKWFGVLSRFCAGSCGLCAMTKCRDYDNSCRVRKSLCLKPESLDYMRENCARTCGFCVIGEESTPPPAEKSGGGEAKKGGEGKPVVVERPKPKNKHRLVVPECTDKAHNCTTNAHLCGSPEFGDYMIKFCTKTCLKCGDGQTGGKAHGRGPIEIVIEPMAADGRRKERQQKCEDRQTEDCARWKSEGLCNGAKQFSEEQRKSCRKTCGNC